MEDQNLPLLSPSNSQQLNARAYLFGLGAVGLGDVLQVFDGVASWGLVRLKRLHSVDANSLDEPQSIINGSPSSPQIALLSLGVYVPFIKA
jgi:hypothetical protein